MAKKRRARKVGGITKIQQIVDYMTAHPDVPSRDICVQFGAVSSQISQARKRIAASQGGNGYSHDDPIGELTKDVRIIKKMGIVRARQVISLIESIQGG